MDWLNRWGPDSSATDPSAGQETPRNVEVSDFIAESLAQILSGVDKAHENLPADSTAKINGKAPAGQHTADDSKRGTHLVKFEIAVTHEATPGAEAGLKLYVASVGAEAKEVNASVSKLQFAIPIVYPSLAQSSDGRREGYRSLLKRVVE